MLDSTKLAVCYNHRIHSHKVFKKLVARGKTSTGWFYGLKLHIVVNEKGELTAMWVTSGNVSDNNPSIMRRLSHNLQQGGKVFRDGSYIS